MASLTRTVAAEPTTSQVTAEELHAVLQQLNALNGVACVDGINIPGVDGGAIVTHKQYLFLRQGPAYEVWYRGTPLMRSMGICAPMPDGLQLWPSIEYAWKYRACVKCHRPALPRCYSEAGRKEVCLSGLCEPCFDVTARGGS